MQSTQGHIAEILKVFLASTFRSAEIFSVDTALNKDICSQAYHREKPRRF